MLTRADPWTNLVRLTSAGFAAAVGGADAVVLGTFTDAIGLPGPLARRMARNTQLVLMEEAHVGAVADPAGRRLGARGSDRLPGPRRLDAFHRHRGGRRRRRGLASRPRSPTRSPARGRLCKTRVGSAGLSIVGVTDFPDAQPQPPDTEDAAAPTPAVAPDPRLPGPDSHCPALAPIRLEELAA